MVNINLIFNSTSIQTTINNISSLPKEGEEIKIFYKGFGEKTSFKVKKVEKQFVIIKPTVDLCYNIYLE